MVKASWIQIHKLKKKNMMKKENKSNKSAIQSLKAIWMEEQVNLKDKLMNKKISMMNSDLYKIKLS